MVKGNSPTKTKGLSNSVKRRARKGATATNSTRSVVAEPAKRQANRIGRASLCAHFDLEVQRQLRMIAAEEQVTMAALFAEGINMLFAKRRKPQIAATAPDGRFKENRA